jgi:general secretion pathway protein I
MPLKAMQTVMSQTKYYYKTAGLTLIEVLIALAIISIAMTAVIQADSQIFRDTRYLQDKTIALWVGQQVLNEARVGIIKLPAAPDKLSLTTTILNKEWHWQAEKEITPNKHIDKIMVQVYENADEEASPLANLESYLYHEA